MAPSPGSRGLGANYLRLWVASVVSNLGDGVRLTALPLLIASLTRDPVLVSGLGLAATLPWFLFALVSGALVDRLDRRRVMWTANTGRCALMLALSLAVLAGKAGPPLLYGVAFLLGTAETLFDNAAQAIMPALVARQELERANGRLYTAEIVTNQFAGPPLGGALFALFAAAPFILDATSFALAAALIASIRGVFRSPTATRGSSPAGSLAGDIAEGLRWLWRHRLLRTLAIMLGVWNALEWATLSIFVLYALEILGLGKVGYGVLLAVGTVGAVIGSLVAPRLVKLGAAPVLIVLVLLGAASSAGIAITASVPVVALMLAVAGFAGVVWNVITVSLRQAIIPDQLLGRVNSAYRLVGWGMMPLGAALGGALAKAFGLRAPFWVMAVVLALMAVLVLPVVNSRTLARARAEADAAG